MALMLNFELFYEHVDVSETRLQKKESISNVGTIFISFWRFPQKKKKWRTCSIDMKLFERHFLWLTEDFGKKK